MIEWKKITDKKFRGRKWELKHNDIVLATIFKQPAAFDNKEKFALYVSSPKIYEHFSESMRTYKFDTFEEAVEAFKTMGKEQVVPWAESVLLYFEELE